ncbi:unnamed protein product [Didymodactylos carnosus]|uniref:ZZ-type domain-containing protein n=2 Tax=Didymodactylos carnosus TaxID=1234261 RepID=A0A8S2EJ37_9BILA|nr:unnamed protein product [Didymodactylos carnosus]CAF3988199.1 unnamed protein product [Didymodactylos carnosus]
MFGPIIIFEIEADLRLKTKPFDNITHIAQYADENEVLFMPGSIFKVLDFYYDEKYKKPICKLQLREDSDPEANEITCVITGMKNNSNDDASTLDRLLSLERLISTLPKHTDGGKNLKFLMHYCYAKLTDFKRNHVSNFINAANAIIEEIKLSHKKNGISLSSDETAQLESYVDAYKANQDKYINKEIEYIFGRVMNMRDLKLDGSAITSGPGEQKGVYEHKAMDYIMEDAWSKGEKAKHESVKSEEFVWSTIVCDRCGMSPIVGLRFHCDTCGNYDICAGCLEKEHEHELKLIDVAEEDDDDEK